MSIEDPERNKAEAQLTEEQLIEHLRQITELLKKEAGVFSSAEFQTLTDLRREIDRMMKRREY